MLSGADVTFRPFGGHFGKKKGVIFFDIPRSPKFGGNIIWTCWFEWNRSQKPETRIWLWKTRFKLWKSAFKILILLTVTGMDSTYFEHSLSIDGNGKALNERICWETNMFFARKSPWGNSILYWVRDPGSMRFFRCVLVGMTLWFALI